MFSLDEILDALSSPMRRRILELLSVSQKPVLYTAIWRHFELPSTGSLNHHLEALTDRRLILRQSTGYILTPRGKIACAISKDLEDSYQRRAIGERRPGGEGLDRDISVKPFQKGDIFGLVLKAGATSSKGPLSEERVRKEIEGNRKQWLELEARGTHGGRISSVVNLLAVEKAHSVGNISGWEEKIQEVGMHKLVIDNIVSFGDPVVSRKLVSGLVDYAKKGGASSVVFCLDDPEDADEAAIVESGAKLQFEARHRYFALQLR